MQLLHVLIPKQQKDNDDLTELLRFLDLRAYELLVNCCSNQPQVTFQNLDYFAEDLLPLFYSRLRESADILCLGF